VSRLLTLNFTPSPQVDEALVPADFLKGIPRGSCRPLYLLVRNAHVVSRVLGANAPELETLIMDAVPQQ